MRALGRILLFGVTVLLFVTFWVDRAAFHHVAVTAAVGTLVVYGVWRAVGDSLLGKMVVAIFTLTFLAALVPK